MRRTVPTEADWQDYRSDLDQKSAHDLFAGKTNEQMQRHFHRNPIEMAESLWYMPEIPFRYYMLGFGECMKGKFKKSRASDLASCFLNLILYKLENHPRHIMPLMPEIGHIIEYVAQNQAAFEASVEIYGDFMEKWKQIQEVYEAQGGLSYSNQLNAFLR